MTANDDEGATKSAPEPLRGACVAPPASHLARVRAFIRKHLPNRDEVEDVMQEVLYQYVRVNSLMRPVEQVGAWMLKVARNEIIDRSRKMREQQLPEYAGNGTDAPFDGPVAEILCGRTQSAEDAWLASLFWEELESALADLPEKQREAFVKTELQGASFKQLAEESGVPVNTLLARKHAAVLFLRERLQELYDDLKYS